MRGRSSDECLDGRLRSAGLRKKQTPFFLCACAKTAETRRLFSKIREPALRSWETKIVRPEGISSFLYSIKLRMSIPAKKMPPGTGGYARLLFFKKARVFPKINDEHSHSNGRYPEEAIGA